MNLNYEYLLNQFSQEVKILEMDLVDDLKGLYIDEFKTIIIDSKISEKEKIAVLLEEWGHYKTTTKNILDLKKVGNSKEEQLAIDYGIKNFISLNELKNAYNNASSEKNDFEIAEYLNIPESFLREIHKYYLRKLSLNYLCK